MSLFPQIGPGILTQLPYAESPLFLTARDEVPSGFGGTYAWRNNPLGMWDLSFSKILAAEFTALKSFYDSMRGDWGEFIFLDPAGNQIVDVSLSNSSVWSFAGMSSSVTGGSGVDPFGGAEATGEVTVTGPGTLTITANCFVDDVFGWRTSAAVWVKGTGSFSLKLTLGSGSDVVSSTVSIPSSGWTRCDVSWLSATHTSSGTPGKLVISLVCGSGAVVATVFNPMVSTMGVCGGPVPSPQGYGRHLYCRFDQSSITQSFPTNPNTRQTSLRIREIHL